jgi:hypothetical protein
MLDEFPALGRLDFFESALAFMAGYGIKSFLIAQSLNQIEKAYGPNNSSLSDLVRQYRGRTVPSAGRPQSLYRQRHRQDGHQRNHGRGITLAVRDADFPRPDYLFSLWLPRLLGFQSA